MFPSPTNLQGGGNIQIGTPAPYAPPIQIQGTGTPTGVLGATTTVAPPPVVEDPYARWGGQTAYNNYVNDYNTGLGGIRTGAGEAFGGLQTGLQGGAENLYNKLRVGQQGINNNRANIELNKRNSIQDILGYVRSGLQQGASRLSNMNALESSAAGALGRAYAQVGNDKSRSVSNQAGIQNRNQDQSQSELELSKQSGITDLHRERDSQVNQISSSLRQQLAQLDQQAAGLGLPGRVAVDQEKQRLINEGMQRLSGVDQWLNSQIATVRPQSQEEIMASANDLRTAGTQGSQLFDLGGFSGQQVSGPAIDSLPLFTRTRRTA